LASTAVKLANQKQMSSKKIINRGRVSLCGWVEIWDENKGKFYYHDPVTNKTSWKHPRAQGIFPEGQELPPILPVVVEQPQEKQVVHEVSQENGTVENTSQDVEPVMENPGHQDVAPVLDTPTDTETTHDVVQEGSERTLMTAQSKKYIKNEKQYRRVQYGYISKMGEINKGYKTRYFVLYTDGELEYYADVPRPKNPDLYVDIAFYKGEFKGQVNVKSTKFCNGKKTNSIEIELHERQFNLIFENKEDYAKWKVALQQVGCEFYELLSPTTRKDSTEKKKDGPKKEKIKRNLKGRAYELGIVDLKDVQ
jgi:hypothetical protein